MIASIVMSKITAKQLKNKGVTAIKTCLEEQSEVVVSVRGKDKYVVMSLAQYHYLRERELEAALTESRANLADGKLVKESVESHITCLDKFKNN